METGLSGRVALITGAASGIGRAVALALAAEGARIVAADINAEHGQATVAELTERGAVARFVHCDVTAEESVEATVSSVIEHEGTLDVMINNAGIGGTAAPLVRSEVADWQRVFEVNLLGVFLGIKHAARAMHGHGGSIVNIASIAGLAASPMLGPYGAAKAGVIQLTQTAALELVKQRIRVNAVCPGWTETAILGDFDRAQLAAQVPMGRVGHVDEIASLVVYLASDAASFITGSAVRVDGGLRS